MRTLEGIPPRSEPWQEVADAAADRLLALHPDYPTPAGPAERRECAEDLARHLLYLSQAAALDAPELFEEHVAWTKSLYAGRGIPASRLEAQLSALAEATSAPLAPPLGDNAATCLRGVLARFDRLPAVPEPCIAQPDGLAQRFTDALLAMRRADATRLVMEAIDAGTPVPDIYIDVFQPALREVGRLWQLNRVTVAHEHYCTAAIQLLMGQLYPRLLAPPRPPRRAVAACVAGELHEVGLRMVADLLEHAGWETYFVGPDLPATGVVGLLAETQAPVLCLSVTVATHLRSAAELIGAVRVAPRGRDVRIVVGGGALARTPQLWRRLGADAYGRDAREAVAACEALLTGTRA